MKLPGAMITFYIKGKKKQTEKLLTSLKVISLAGSLGGVESLISSPPFMSHHNVDKEVKEHLGYTEN